jgi:putative membrane protein
MEILGQWHRYDWGMGPGMRGYGYGMSWSGDILSLIFWIVVIVGIIFLIRRLFFSYRPEGSGRTDGDTALDIIKKRYARGEIDKQEYEEKKRDMMT